MIKKSGSPDRATIEAAINAERRASDVWQMRACGVCVMFTLIGFAVLHLSFTIAILMFVMAGVGAFGCAYMSFVHIARSGRYRRLLARADGEKVTWYTGLTDTLEQRERTVALWQKHPVMMSLNVTVIIALTVTILVARFHTVH